MIAAALTRGEGRSASHRTAPPPDAQRHDPFPEPVFWGVNRARMAVTDEGELQPANDNRLAWILQHQARIPESQAELVPEYIESLGDYRRRMSSLLF